MTVLWEWGFEAASAVLCLTAGMHHDCGLLVSRLQWSLGGRMGIGQAKMPQMLIVFTEI